jgi:GTP diphosphokinase / guanosine-3',5'-bis(diphosphate) 3'-diphosphatase
MTLPKQFNESLHYFNQAEKAIIRSAYNLALKCHRDQYRVSGEPYITHPVAVAKILADMKMDHETVSAGLLHDTVEDSELKINDIHKNFGTEIACLVDGVTKLEKYHFSSIEQQKSENIRKLIQAMEKDPRVIIIKLVDRLHNLYSMELLSRETQISKAQETLDVYAPIAKKLGIYKLSLELEQKSFKLLYPLRCNIINNALNKIQGNNLYLLEEIKTKIQKKLTEKKIKYISISAREKHAYSVYRKIKNKKISFHDIFDVFGIRIIVNNIEDCYRLLGLVHLIYKPVYEKVKDYIALPKLNGYQSLHTVLFGPHGVPIEIQIRTLRMDRQSDKGIAAHWMYKSKLKESSKIVKKTRSIIQLLFDIENKSLDSKEFLSDIKKGLIQNEIYIYTTNGKMVELPEGSTALDFAYYLKPELGHYLKSISIDKKNESIFTILKSGQHIILDLSKDIQITPAWINIVSTGKAKACIREFFNNMSNAKQISYGKKLFNDALASYGQELKTISKKQFDEFILKMGFKEYQDFFISLTRGEKIPILLAHRFFSPENSHHSETVNSPIMSDSTGYKVRYAPCCLPMPYDKVIGMVDKSFYLVIHRRCCAKLTNSMEDIQNYIPLSWKDNLNQLFPTKISLTLENKCGALASLLEILSMENKINILEIKFQNSNEKTAYIHMKILLKNTRELERIILQLNLSSFCSKVKRL